MKKYIFQLFLFSTLVFEVSAQKINSKKVWSDAEQQIQLLLKETRANRLKQLVFPRTTVHDSLKMIPSGDWTSGFFPGILWFLYEKTNDQQWKQAAQEFTGFMVKEPYNGNSHDVGFKVYNSYGSGYRMTKDTAYKRLIVDAAKTLSKRFNPTVGCIRSWDFGKWQYPVIIDNMMNLELLFEATKLSGDSSFYKIAVSHANTTMKNHFRNDFSSYHLVNYDPTTGNAIGKMTVQGYGDESAWARGQAWGLYGYTMCYSETGEKKYLKQAEDIASFILNNPNLPKDKVPYWDYNAPGLQTQPRDASAAAVMASALYELSGYSQNGKNYRKAADKIIESLTKNYRNLIGTNHGFILSHGTGHKPADGEIDVPLVYADYYYLEALLRSQKK